MQGAQTDLTRSNFKRALAEPGYPAELLPKVCDLFLDAGKAGALTRNPVHIARQSPMPLFVQADSNG